MADPSRREEISRQGRVLALVIAAVTLTWLALQALGSELNWSLQAAFAIDAAAIVGYLWALVQAFGLWRTLRDGGS